MNNGNCGEEMALVSRCAHVEDEAEVFYVVNDGQRPPVLAVRRFWSGCLVILTNQTIYLKCQACYQASMSLAESKLLRSI